MSTFNTLWIRCSFLSLLLTTCVGSGLGDRFLHTKQFLDSPGTSCVSYNSTQLWHCWCGASLRSHRLKLSPTRLVSLSLEASVTRPGIPVLLNDCLWIRGSHDPLLRFDEFIGVAHRTQENSVFTRLPVHYKWHGIKWHEWTVRWRQTRVSSRRVPNIGASIPWVQVHNPISTWMHSCSPTW